MTEALTIAYLIFRTRENTGTKVVIQHVRALRKKGHSVLVYTLFGKPASWFPDDIRTQSVFHLVIKNPDILVATFWPTAYVVALLRAKRKFYCIMGWEEDFYTNPLIRFFARTSYRLPLGKIVLSDYLTKRLQRYLNRREPTQKIVTYRIDDQFFQKPVLRKSSRKRKVILSIISWYNRYKGPDLLLTAIRELKKRHPEYYFILAGRERYKYAPEIDEFHSNPPTQKLIQLYKKADCMLITSRVEGFYIPGLEAMANGLPVVTTNSGGVLEYAKNGKTAIVLNTLESLWKQDILQKLFADTKARKSMIDEAYTVALKYRQYSEADLGESLEEIFLK